MTPCEELGYKEGYIFKHKNLEYGGGGLMVLHRDDGTEQPYFIILDSMEAAVPFIDDVILVYPPKEQPKKVSVTINGVETQISHESALALKEALKDLS